MGPRKVSLAYFVVGIGLLSLYGTQVCPFFDDLSPWIVLSLFAGGFGVAGLVKLALEPHWVDRAATLERPWRQLVFEIALYSFMGLVIGIFDWFVFRFPLGSAFKVLVGCVSLGVFAGIDGALRREYESTLAIDTPTTPAARLFPVTKKLALIQVFMMSVAGVVAGMIIFSDIDWVMQNRDAHAEAYLWRTVLLDLGFVLAVLLLLFGRLIVAYSRNLKRLFEIQIRTLERVEQGRLDTRVPIVTSDEFSLIADKTNQMIRGLKLAQDDERCFFEIALAISTEIKLRPLLCKIMETAGRFVGADRATLFLHDAKRDELWSIVAEGYAEPIRIAADAGIAGHVFTTGEPVILEDAYADPRFNATVDRHTGYRTASILCMPVSNREGERIGVIQALNRSGGPFTANDMERARAFCAQAGIALVNAQLFDEVNEMKNYNESMLASMSDGVVSLDDGQRIVKVNPAAARMLGAEADLVDRSVDEVFAPPNDWVLAAIERMNATGEPSISIDADLRFPDCDTSVNLNTVPLVSLKQEKIGAMLVLEDITTEKRVRSTMARYMTKEVADRLLEQGELALGGTTQVASILFSDIRGFTTLSERLGAVETVELLNGYFSAVVEEVFDHQGTLDKFIGDALMAVFGAPFANEGDADNAVRAAIDMMGRLKEFNAERAARGYDPIDVGIGIGTGEVVVGNIGSAKRMDYTVIGDPVNLASRLEGANKLYDSRILISEATRADLKQPVRLREVDRIRVKGKQIPVGVHEVLDHYTDETFPEIEATLESYETGLAAYRERDWQRARACFEAALALRPGDGPSRLYVERCGYFTENPPAAGWDGVWTMDHK